MKFSGPIEEITLHEKAFDEFVASIRIPGRRMHRRPTPPAGLEGRRQADDANGDLHPAGRMEAAQKPPELYISEKFQGTLLMNVNRWRDEVGIARVTEAELPKVTTEVMLGGTKAYKVDFKGPGGKKKMPPFAGGDVAPPSRTRDRLRGEIRDEYHRRRPHDREQPQPRRAAANPLRAVLKALASLQLTVGLFALGVGLVFFGTLAQKGVGIWTVVEQYFWSWVVMVDLQHLVEFGKIFFGLPPDMTVGSWARFPFPGGKLIGGLMFVNLLAAHALRFKLTWKRSGIFILHGGVLLLFVGEFITREFQVEQQMRIPEGGSADLRGRHPQLRTRLHRARRRRDRPRHGRSRPEAARMRPAPAADQPPGTAGRCRGDAATCRTAIWSRHRDPRGGDNPATAGEGLGGVAIPLPEVSGADTGNKMDLPSALRPPAEEGHGRSSRHLPRLDDADSNRRRSRSASRSTASRSAISAYYKPFTFNLVDFRFDRYVGHRHSPRTIRATSS